MSLNFLKNPRVVGSTRQNVLIFNITCSQPSKPLSKRSIQRCTFHVYPWTTCSMLNPSNFSLNIVPTAPSKLFHTHFRNFLRRVGTSSSAHFFFLSHSQFPMGLLDQLWDDTLAGPRPESGLGKLRKHSTFSGRPTSGNKGMLRPFYSTVAMADT